VAGVGVADALADGTGDRLGSGLAVTSSPAAQPTRSADPNRVDTRLAANGRIGSPRRDG
jgi:hypothetical protein